MKTNIGNGWLRRGPRDEPAARCVTGCMSRPILQRHEFFEVYHFNDQFCRMSMR